MIAFIVPFSGIQTNNYTEWCIVCELLQKSIIVLNIAINFFQKVKYQVCQKKVQRKEENPTKKLYWGTNIQNTAENHIRISSMPRGASTILKWFLTHISLSLKSSNSREYSTSLTNFSSTIIVRKKLSIP